MANVLSRVNMAQMATAMKIARDLQEVERVLQGHKAPTEPNTWTLPELVDYLEEWGITFDWVAGQWTRSSTVPVVKGSHDGV